MNLKLEKYDFWCCGWSIFVQFELFHRNVLGQLVNELKS